MTSRILAVILVAGSVAACGQTPSNGDSSVVDAAHDAATIDARDVSSVDTAVADAHDVSAPETLDDVTAERLDDVSAEDALARDDAPDVIDAIDAIDTSVDDAAPDAAMDAAAVDVATDAPLDVPPADDVIDASDSPDAGPCVAGRQRCDGARVETCFVLADGTSAWAVTTMCDGLQTCAGTPPSCVLPDVEPAGGVVASIGTYADGLPQGVVWNGTSGTALFHWGDGGSRRIALFQFTSSGLTGGAYTSDLMQGGRLVAAGSNTVAFWHDGGSHSYLALVGAGPTLGSRVAVTVGGGPVYQGFTLAGAANGAMLAGAGSLGTADGAFTWFDARTPSTRALTPTLLNNGLETGVSAEIATGIALAWQTPDNALAFQTTDGSATLIGSAVRSTAPWPSSDRITLVALVPRSVGYVFIWSDLTTRTLHFAHLDAAGALTDDRVVITDYDSRNVVSPFIGTNGSEILIARGIFNTVNSVYYYALAIRGLDDTGAVTRPEFLVSSRSAVATYAAGSLAVCWSVDADEGGRGGATGPHCAVRGL